MTKVWGWDCRFGRVLARPKHRRDAPAHQSRLRRLAARRSRSPCPVRMRPRARRWNSGTFKSCSRTFSRRLTADWPRPRDSPAWVNDSAAAAPR